MDPAASSFPRGEPAPEWWNRGREPSGFDRERRDGDEASLVGPRVRGDDGGFDASAHDPPEANGPDDDDDDDDAGGGGSGGNIDPDDDEGADDEDDDDDDEEPLRCASSVR